MVNIIQPSTFCARTDRHIEVIRFSKGKAMHVCLSACLPVCLPACLVWQYRECSEEDYDIPVQHTTRQRLEKK